jgi:hypothetical protein
MIKKCADITKVISAFLSIKILINELYLIFFISFNCITCTKSSNHSCEYFQNIF